MSFTENYKIISGNFKRAGLASRRLKDRLKKLGIAPEILRRIMIAAYEAEMNVVIHANDGEMWVTLDEQQICIDVHDQGPGIPDLELAMREGFSTASAHARSLGFGAGMGLPNIKKHSDQFEIASTVGQGTHLTSIIFLKKQRDGNVLPHSLTIKPELCCGCLQCLHACPTRAIRVLHDRPHILDDLCIDCTACIAACETGALVMRSPEDIRLPVKDTVLALPSSCLVQFVPEATPHKVLALLQASGFHPVWSIERWEAALRLAVVTYAADHPECRPIISPVCPAVINLIALRFPALLDNIALFLSPLEAVRQELHGQQAVVIPVCPCQQTAIVRQGVTPTLHLLLPAQLLQGIMPLLHQHPEPPVLPPEQSGGHEPAFEDVLHVSGLRNVLNTLEKAENGVLNDVPVVELYVCDQGCFGSPLLKEVPYLAQYRWLHTLLPATHDVKAIPRQTAFLPRAGQRLAQDMTEAIQKLADIDRITKELPGKNCGMCGAPTCAALAEDIVLRQAGKERCIYRRNV